MGSDWELPINVVSFLGSSPLFSLFWACYLNTGPRRAQVSEALVTRLRVRRPGVDGPASQGTRSRDSTPGRPERTGPGRRRPRHATPFQPWEAP